MQVTTGRQRIRASREGPYRATRTDDTHGTGGICGSEGWEEGGCTNSRRKFPLYAPASPHTRSRLRVNWTSRRCVGSCTFAEQRPWPRCNLAQVCTPPVRGVPMPACTVLPPSRPSSESQPRQECICWQPRHAAWVRRISPSRLPDSRSGACVVSRNLVATTWRALRTTLLAVYSLFHRHVYSAWRSPASESFATRTASHLSSEKRIAMAYSASAIMRPTEGGQPLAAWLLSPNVFPRAHTPCRPPGQPHSIALTPPGIHARLRASRFRSNHSRHMDHRDRISKPPCFPTRRDEHRIGTDMLSNWVRAMHD
jgi:hypothetical protein